MATVNEAIKLAISHHQGGRIHEAEQIYRQILGDDPRHAGAHHLLGLLELQRGNPQLALDLISRAIQLDPAQAVFHVNLGETHRTLGCLAEAEVSYRDALAIQPDGAEILNNLGTILQALGRIAEATDCYSRAI